MAAYKRRNWILLFVAWFVIFIAVTLSMSGLVNGTVCLVIAAVGRCVVGVAVWMSAAAKQIPLLVRYTTLRDDEIQNRLEELKDADAFASETKEK